MASLLKQIPNALTLARLVLAPVVGYAVWRTFADESWGPVALGLFVVAALTDLFDGMAARAFDAHSKFGRVIDPIADKALVGLPLIAISAVMFMRGVDGGVPVIQACIVAVSAAVIVGRDLTITLIRMRASDGEGIRVSKLAKWKTAAEMVAVAAALLALSITTFGGCANCGLGVAPWITFGWIGLLVIAASLSAVTGIQYLGAMRRAAATRS